MAKRPGKGRAPLKPVGITGFSHHFGLAECIGFVAEALVRDGHDENALAPYQLALFRDLESPLDEEALAEMLEYWRFDLDALFKRGRGWPRGAPAKPRIDVTVFVTSKGNLKAEWFPHDWQNGYNETDFKHFVARTNRSQSVTSRPSNELMFIHGFYHVLTTVRHGKDGLTSDLDNVLTRACECVVELLKERLAYHFEVNLLQDMYVEWQDRAKGDWDKPREDRVHSIVFEDPKERLRRAELEELGQLETRLGFSEGELESALEAVLGETASSTTSLKASAPSVTQVLKKRGYRATPKPIERALYLLETYRRKSTADILQFKRGND